MLPCREIQRIHRRFYKYVIKLTKRSYGSTNVNVKRTKLVLTKYNRSSSTMCCRHVSQSQSMEPVEHGFLPQEFVVDDVDLPASSRLRNVLYPHTDDIVINELKCCKSLRELFATVEQHSPATPQHLAQAVLTYRDLIKLKEESVTDSNNNDADDSNDTWLAADDQLDDLIKSVQRECSRMDSDELSSCILHLSKCGVDPHVIRDLIQSYEQLVRRSNDEQISVTSLARFTIAVREFGNIWSLYTLSNIAPILYRKLDTCDNHDQLGKIIISFQRFMPLLNETTIEKFVSKCSTLLAKQNNVEGETRRSRCALKACTFLTFHAWNLRYVNLVKQMLLSLKGNVKYLHFSDLIYLRKIILLLQEPYEILNEVREHELDHSFELRDSSDVVKYSFLNCAMPKMWPISEDGLRHLIESYWTKPLAVGEFMIQMKLLYMMLFNVETKRNQQLGDMYWNRLVSLMGTFPSLRSDEKLLSTVLKYLNYSYTKRYRNEKFEAAVLSWLHTIFEHNGKMIYKPASFVTIALSIMIFSQSRPNFTNDTWQRISRCISLLDVHDNLIASFVLNMAMRTTRTRRKFSSLLQYHMNISSSLNNNSLAYLSSHNEISIDVLNAIFRAYIHRKCAKDSKIFTQLSDRLNNCAADELCSKTIRDTVHNLYRCCHLEAHFVDRAVGYCIEQKDIVHTYLLTFVLGYLFSFGYVPEENCDAFIKTTLELVDRDIEHLSRNKLVKAALALCYFNELPSHLTDVIFDVKFLNDWEEEVKRTSDASMKHDFMELNRTVCVEYPHRDIPWFHDNYCREKLTLECRNQNSFLDDVCSVLKGMVNVNESIVKNSLSPYYHEIDILFHTDRRGEPVDANLCDTTNLRKTAILLLENKTSPALHYLGKGTMELKVRQLEMLDYNVVVIDKRVWYSMYMSEPLAKENYLCSRIWNKSNIGIQSNS